MYFEFVENLQSYIEELKYLNFKFSSLCTSSSLPSCILTICALVLSHCRRTFSAYSSMMCPQSITTGMLLPGQCFQKSLFGKEVQP